MYLSTKKKYVKIVNTRNQILRSLGANVSYVSISRIIELTDELLFKTDGIRVTKGIYYRALKYCNTSPEENLFLED